MQCFLFAFGKLKTAGIADTAAYYQRILRPWLSVEEHELKPLAVPEKSPAMRKQIQSKEGALLIERLKKVHRPGGKLLLLDETGPALSTEKWVEQWSQWRQEAVPSVIYCIGSSLGFDAAVRQLATGSVSFGPQTVSHEIARLVLWEQLYRVQSVIHGHPYHNGGSG
jgi:23S rRNA (pseudouridine1915-N3)-methyltransferase